MYNEIYVKFSEINAKKGFIHTFVISYLRLKLDTHSFMSNRDTKIHYQSSSCLYEEQEVLLVVLNNALLF